MAGGNRRKCRCCLKLFRPDPRNRHHQRYCSATACRAASKAASQARWRTAPENQGYFRGPVTSLGSRRGGRAIPGIGAGLDVSALRYKISQRRNLLNLFSEQPLRRAHRYKRS
jgi:hypothetical protein